MKNWVKTLLEGNQERGRGLLLNYVGQGELGDKLIHLLGHSALGFSTSAEWVIWAQSHGGLDSNHLHRLTVMLFPERRWEERYTPASGVSTLGDLEEEGRLFATPQPDRAGRCLDGISQWWQREGATRSQRWEESVYPEKWRGDQLRQGLMEANNESWLVLFVVALNERLGRTQEGQGAVGFIRLLEESGWWQCLVDRPEASFLPELKAWLKRDEQYRTYDEWLSLIPWIYQARVWMEDYHLLLQNPIRAIGTGSFTNLWRPGINSNLNGTRIDAPLFQQMIGLSGRFVLRELLRMGVIDDPSGALSHHAYVPRLAVRRFLALLGLLEKDSVDREAGSKAIYEFLGKHLVDPTFSGSFDLPLRIVALDPKLRDAAWNGSLLGSQ